MMIFNITSIKRCKGEHHYYFCNAPAAGAKGFVQPGRQRHIRTIRAPSVQAARFLFPLK